MPDEKLRIIHCFRSPVGGIFRHVRDLIDIHAAEGHEIGIFCDSLTGGLHEERLFKEIEPKLALGLTRIPMRRAITPGDLAAFYRSYRHFKELKPDVLHSHGAKGGAYARIIGSVLRVSGSSVARLYCPHGGSIHYDEKSLKGKLFFTLERAMERLTDCLVFVSDYEQRGYINKVGKPRCRTRLVYNGLNKAEFKPVAASPKAADFLYIGMMRDLKGPDVFLQALGKLHASGHKPTAHFVGDGPDKDRYQTMIGKLGLEANITVHDAMPARKAFAIADVVVVPSRAESMPYIVLEAIAAQKPVICTRVGGIPEIFGDDADRLVQPGDPKALADAMAAALSDRHRSERAKKMQKALQKRFSVEVMAHDVMQAYRTCL